MKKFAGIVPPTFVRADEGKNGVPGPPPSACMLSGGFSGLTIAYRAVPLPLQRGLDEDGDHDRGAEQQDAGGRQPARPPRDGRARRQRRATRRRAERQQRRAPHACTGHARWRATHRHTRARHRPPHRAGRRSRRSTRPRATGGASSGRRPAMRPRRPRRGRRAARRWCRKTALARRRRRDRRCWPAARARRQRGFQDGGDRAHRGFISFENVRAGQAYDAPENRVKGRRGAAALYYNRRVHFVYIVRCADGTFTPVTRAIRARARRCTTAGAARATPPAAGQSAWCIRNRSGRLAMRSGGNGS